MDNILSTESDSCDYSDAYISVKGRKLFQKLIMLKEEIKSLENVKNILHLDLAYQKSITHL